MAKKRSGYLIIQSYRKKRPGVTPLYMLVAREDTGEK